MQFLSQSLINAQKQLQEMRERNGYQQASLSFGPSLAEIASQFVIVPSAGADSQRTQPEVVEAISHHGDMAIGAMRVGMSSHYQLWLGLRLLDVLGRGWLMVDEVKAKLTDEDSGVFLYRWPRLRQLLAEGGGLFWVQGNGRIWLRRMARVAAGLGIARLNGRFCSIVKDDVFGRVAVFRAHCYAAWLANHMNPMSQETIEHLTGIAPRTQRRYCKLAGIEVQQNITIGPVAAVADRQVCAWQHGNVFDFVDYRGCQGPAFRRYIAWHLPASYVVNGALGSRRQQRRVNQQIAAGLAQTETLGNGSFVRGRLFFANGKAAAKAASRQMSAVPTTDIYWKQRQAKSGTGIWNVISVSAGLTV